MVNSDHYGSLMITLRSKFQFFYEICAWQCQAFLVYKRHSSSSDRKRIERRRLSITPARRETLAFLRKSRDSPSRRASGYMGGDLSAVVASTSRRPRTSECLVKDGSRPVQIATPAFQPPPVCHDSGPGHQVVTDDFLRK